MNGLFNRWSRHAALAVGLFAIASVAYADVFGRLKIVVKNADDEKPVAGAKVVLHDSAGVKADITLISDANGIVNTGPLEARAWKVTVTMDAFDKDERDFTVVADTTSDIEVLLEPQNEKVIKIKGDKILIKVTDPSTGVRRDQDFVKRFPATAGNPQSLSKFLRSNPGLAEDSNGQVHPRGEHSSTTIYINGFQLPGAFQGRAGQVLAPGAIESLDLLTGGYAPEYGSETAAILNVKLKSGPMAPFASYDVQGGGYGTFYGGLTFGGQTGEALGAPDANGRSARRLRYLFDFSARRTDNQLEPPQPDDQMAHNQGRSFTGFSNLEYEATSQDTFGLMLSTNPAKTQVANRTGLPSRYAAYGQGYGYGGTLSKEEADLLGIVSQQDAGQDIEQEDRNSMGVLSWRRNLGPNTSSFLSFGVVHSGLDITNNNPDVDLNDLPENSSIEFNPTIIRNAHNSQIQGSVSHSINGHNLKFGFVYDNQTGNESYQLIPASQAALDALLELDPRLVPDGDTPSTLKMKRDGYYFASYIQDTWKATPKLTVNYGLRFDTFKQDQNAKATDGSNEDSSVNESQLSPRLNMAYALTPKTVVRASYNRLFIQPPLAQGSFLGSQIKPERLHQFDFSVEHQIGARQTLKAAAYYKDIEDQIDTGLLVEGTQIGAYTSVSLGKGQVRGLEFTYELAPKNNRGFSAYATWANALAKPSGTTNTGEEVDDAYNDHDQLNTISGGLNYTFHNDWSTGLSVYYGSGFASSVLDENSGKRSSRTQVNFRVAKANLFGNVGLSLEVENLFDQRALMNFQSAFSGTRFQQGRRILLSLNGKF